jgi:hypothetical protein
MEHFHVKGLWDMNKPSSDKENETNKPETDATPRRKVKKRGCGCGKKKN